MEETKICPKCGRAKPLKEFHRDRTTRDGLCCWCKSCKSECSRRYSAKRRVLHADYLLQYRFGITLAEYDEMLELQGSGCAICGKTPGEEGKRLCVDHNHSTGRVRGLLCSECNAELGQFHDDPDRLRSAATYAEKWCED